MAAGVSRPSEIAHSTIDHEFAADSESTFIGRQEHHGLRDFIG
jgi:hypothetical protein